MPKRTLALQPNNAVSTPLWQIFKNAQLKDKAHHFGRYSKMHYQKISHSFRITCERSESAQERRTALHKSDQQHSKVYADYHTFRSFAGGTGRCRQNSEMLCPAFPVPRVPFPACLVKRMMMASTTRYSTFIPSIRYESVTATCTQV